MFYIITHKKWPENVLVGTNYSIPTPKVFVLGHIIYDSVFPAKSGLGVEYTFFKDDFDIVKCGTIEDVVKLIGFDAML